MSSAALSSLRSSSPSKKQQQQNENNDDEDIANELNRYFASVFRSDDRVESLPEVRPLECSKGLYNVDFTPENVEKAIASFRIDTSPGPDGVNARTLKCLSGIIAYRVA